MNVTNIDDKIIKRSLETGKNYKLMADEYEAEFWEDLDKLNVIHPDIKLRVTDKIPEILKFIEKIERKGLTKRSTDGSVVFNTSCYSNYGKLHKVILDDSTSAEFALWKVAKENEPSWPSKWGDGRPGWHIECSTLASTIFGSHLDFHAGGIDLKFPHHENEEAQSCVAHDCKDWVTNWIHTGHLHLKGQSEKMSKSLKNTVSIRELLEDHTSDQFRMACLLSHYRSSIEFGPELMNTADTVLKRLQSFNSDSKAFIDGIREGFIDVEILSNQFAECKKDVDEALRDDFHTSVSIGHITELIKTASKMINSKDGNQPKSSFDKALLMGVIAYIDGLFKMFGIASGEAVKASNNNHKLDNLLNSIIEVRNQVRLHARESKNKELYKVCDELRKALQENQIEVKDHGNLSSWSKI